MKMPSKETLNNMDKELDKLISNLPYDTAEGRLQTLLCYVLQTDIVHLYYDVYTKRRNNIIALATFATAIGTIYALTRRPKQKR